MKQFLILSVAQYVLHKSCFQALKKAHKTRKSATRLVAQHFSRAFAGFFLHLVLIKPRFHRNTVHSLRTWLLLHAANGLIALAQKCRSSCAKSRLIRCDHINASLTEGKNKINPQLTTAARGQNKVAASSRASACDW